MRDYDFNDQNAHHLLRLGITGEPEKTVLIVSPCRSGGTALLASLSFGDWSGVFQPVKTALRRYLVDVETPVVIKAGKPKLAIKESLGPYVPSEVHYNPLQVLRNKGLNEKNLSLVTILREPEDCLASWQRSFSKSSFQNFQPRLFSTAYKATLQTLQQAQAEGLPAIALTLSDLSRPDALSAAFNKIGVSFDEKMVDWKKSPDYQLGAYPFDKPEEPSIFQVKGLLDGIKHGTGLFSEQARTHLSKKPDIPEDVANMAGLQRAIEVFGEYLDLQKKISITPCMQPPISRKPRP